MIDMHNVAEFADFLRTQGLDAKVDHFRNLDHGFEIGLRVSEYFYPLWELNASENRADLSELNFDAIRARRGPGWTVEGPDDRPAKRE